MQVECVTLDSSDEDNGDEVSAQPHKNKRRRISMSEEEEAISLYLSEEEEEAAASASGKLSGVVALRRILA